MGQVRVTSGTGSARVGRVFARGIILTVALFYAYGALVHVMNMTSLTGFDWVSAPMKWRVLDIVYLMLDIAVVAGLVLKKRFGLIAFFAAALSQIVLYTAFRSWIVDVPTPFQRSAEQIAYLDTLVLFHLVTIVAVVIAIIIHRTTGLQKQ
ncbi:hypothetical protein ACERZ8_10335 [Tateyamaria armeniaca]|uniref:Uncharacterized protein n=1 Tax=Tateyamaria armeniaca TaxID=2518930 RepID=A0ABW8UYM5_9RHOB